MTTPMAVRLTPLFSVVLLLFARATHAEPAGSLEGYPADYVFIDCGSLEAPGPNSFITNITRAAAGSVSYTVSGTWEDGAVTTEANLSPAEASFRTFPDGKGCYSINAPKQTYSVRLGFAYFANDGLSGGAPNFTVSLQGDVVDQVALADWEDEANYDVVGTMPWGALPKAAHYTEYVTTTDGTTPLEICLEAVNDRSPLVNTIELVPTEIPEMGQFLPEMKWKLSLKKRFNMAGPTVGPTVAEDPLLRKWEDPTEAVQIYFQFPLVNLIKPEYSNITLPSAGNGSQPAGNVKALVQMKPGLPKFPSAVFETALEGGKLNESDPKNPQFLGIRFNYFPYSSFNQMLVRLLFADIDGAVTSPGQRVFNISFAAKVVREKYLWEGQWHDETQSNNFDILKRAQGGDTGILAPFMGCYPEPMDYRRNVSLFLFLSSLQSDFPPILNAVELYEVIAPIPASCPVLKTKAALNSSSSSRPPVSGGGEEEEAPEQGLRVGAIVGIVVACIVGVGVLVAGVVLLIKLRAHHKATSFHRFHQSEGLVSAGP